MNIRMLLFCFFVLFQIGNIIAVGGWQLVENKNKTHKENKKERKKQSVESKLLIKASLFGNEYQVRQLLSRKSVDVNETDKEGRSALMVTARYGYDNVATLLIDGGADVNQKNMDGQTTLMLAAYEDRANLIDVLVQHGAVVDERDGQGSTALMHAASRCAARAVAKLIAYKANVNLQDNLKGRTPLHWALRMRKGAAKKDGKQNDKVAVCEIIKLLLAAEANPKIKDAEKLTPLNHAEHLGWAEEASLLRRKK